jgi:hypothetical protein
MFWTIVAAILVALIIWNVGGAILGAILESERGCSCILIAIGIIVGGGILLVAIVAAVNGSDTATNILTTLVTIIVIFFIVAGIDSLISQNRKKPAIKTAASSEKTSATKRTVASSTDFYPCIHCGKQLSADRAHLHRCGAKNDPGVS